MRNTRNIRFSALRLLLAATIVAVAGCLPLHASIFKDFIHTYTNTAAVGSVFVDENGTAWVGTTNGLMQYDDLKRDYSIRFAMPEELRVPIHMIYGLSDGRMAVVTRGMKKYLFDPVSYRVTEIDTEWLGQRGIDAPGPWAIEIVGAPHAPAMIVAGEKVYTLDPAPGHKAELVKTLSREALELTADGNYYHIVTPTAIFSYDTATGQFDETAYPFGTFATRVIKDGAGNIWLGDKHLYRHDADGMHWDKLRDNVMVTEITRSGSDIYVATSSSGILHYTDDGELAGEIHNNPFDINTPVSDHCAHVYVDGNDNLWVAYNKCDLSISSHYYDVTKGRHIEDLQHKCIKDDIISLLPVDGGTLVAGTDGNGLFVVDAETGISRPETQMLRSKVPGASITALFLDSRKRLWAGSFRNGLICLDGGSVTRLLPDTSPYSIVEDIDGNIYVGTSGNGLFRINADLSGTPAEIDIDNEAWVQQLSCDRSGTLYAATTSGLFRIDTRTQKSTALIGPNDDAARRLSSVLNSFYRDSRSLMWLICEGTPNSLNILDAANDSLYTIPSLADVKFISVAEDDNKNIWLASDNDIYNIVPQYDPATRSYTFRHYVYHVRSNETTPNRYNSRAVAKMPDGRLLFGGMNGYQIVDPGKYQQLGQMANIKGRLSGLKVNNTYVIPNALMDGNAVMDKDISHVDKITLKSTSNNLNFLFSPHDYDLPFKIEYYYRLDSSKNEWYPIVGNNVELVNLNPGRYHLEVCAMSPEGLMTGEVDGVDIEILSPWYLTAWAYVVYLILLFVILIMVIYYFIDRQKQKLTMAQTEKEMDRQRQLNDMKLQFFTNISHDFRTPLSIIITTLEAYLGSHSDSDTKRFLKPVHKNALQLLNLVNQILDFRKLDVTGVPLHLSYGDIVSYIKEICASFNLFSEDSGIKLEVNTSLPSLNMYFDKDKLGKIMMNLLSNAFKYNNEGGAVAIGINTAGDNVEISVSDTGRGIPDADKARIFDRFYQSGNRQHTAMGCGIGLHIVKEFVELHGGTVEVQDNEPQGTRFVVTLPVVRSIESEKAQAAETPAAETRALLPASGKPVTESRATILLVEDNQDFIDFMEQSLADDYNVLKASNGEQALEVLESETVDIIISDVMMDRMDGLELCKAVKSDIRISHVPVILLTAKSLAEDEMRGLESGADDYITKPFSMPILRQRISKLIDENRRSQEKFRRIPDISPSEITITPLDEKFLSDTIKVVEENMSNPDFSVEMLSTHLGMHRTHLYKKLSCITGKTPIEFIRLIRLKRAAQYLAQSQMYISEIAYKVGFNNPRLLSKYFKEEYNMTPREYIRSLGIDNDKKTEEE
ncbi:MAG: response regulator [Muribaculaceae bacterium]|nr:response regulator [Muribaculaceae bacterium]